MEFNKIFGAPAQNNAWDRIKNNYALVGRGRDAIALISRDLKLQQSDEVLVPAFSCEIIAETFSKFARVVFYDINDDLSININEVKKNISLKTKAIFFIHYFGFNSEGAIAELKKLGFPVIEDATHTWLTGPMNKSDYYIASLRKLLPIPIGCTVSGTRFSGRYFYKKALNLTPFKTELFRMFGLFGATMCKKRPSFVLRWITSEICYKTEMYLEAQKELPKVTGLIIRLLKRYDLQKEIIERRIKYQEVSPAFSTQNDFKLVRPSLADADCPLGIPVRIKRQELWRRVFEYSGIQALALWKLPDKADPDKYPVAAALAREILLMPSVTIDTTKTGSNIYNEIFTTIL